MLILLLFYSLCACDDVLIEENKRIEIKGSMVSPENEPVSGIEIFSVGSRDGWIGPDTDKILGKGRSDENGEFNFISLDTDSHGLVLAINPSEIDQNSSYASLYFYDSTGDHAGLYDFDKVTVAQRLEFQFSISNTSGVQDTLLYTLRYKQPVLNYIYENEIFVEQEPPGNFISLRQHTPDSDPAVHRLSVLGATEIVFSYGLGESEVQQILIPVGTEDNSYDFEY